MWGRILTLVVIFGVGSGCQSTPTRRTLAFSSEKELAEFVDSNVPRGCDPDVAKSLLESSGFTCKELDISGRRILHCSRQETISAYVKYHYVAELEIIDNCVADRKAKIWGTGP